MTKLKKINNQGKERPNAQKKKLTALWITIVIHNGSEYEKTVFSLYFLALYLIVFHSANGCAETMFSLLLLALYFSDINPMLEYIFDITITI